MRSVHGENIEAAGLSIVQAMTREVVAGGQQDALLLAPVDALGGGTESAGAAITNFHEDDAFAAAHDEIDLAPTAAVVARQRDEATRIEVLLGGFLEARADGSRSITITGVRGHHAEGPARGR